jgi:hypothetical protein
MHTGRACGHGTSERARKASPPYPTAAPVDVLTSPTRQLPASSRSSSPAMRAHVYVRGVRGRARLDGCT